MGFIVLLLWVFVLVPAILLADALPWKWLPVVPLVTQLLAGASILFAASYVYVLYRRMLDAAPKNAAASRYAELIRLLNRYGYGITCWIRHRLMMRCTMAIGELKHIEATYPELIQSR